MDITTFPAHYPYFHGLHCPLHKPSPYLDLKSRHSHKIHHLLHRNYLQKLVTVHPIGLEMETQFVFQHNIVSEQPLSIANGGNFLGESTIGNLAFNRLNPLNMWYCDIRKLDYSQQVWICYLESQDSSAILVVSPSWSLPGQHLYLWSVETSSRRNRDSPHPLAWTWEFLATATEWKGLVGRLLALI